MRSWDIWDTLIARRSMSDIHNEKDNIFPIVENVSRVAPEDIIVSDFYDKDLAERLIREVAGINNECIITHDGKLTGNIWPILKSKYNIIEHIGDNPHSDVTSPMRHGIKGTLSSLSGFTAIESQVDSLGAHGLARIMRESRLSTWNERYRRLQLVQSQVNFPLLFSASILLHRTNPAKLLMVSRDCCLWQHIQKIIREVCGGKYGIEYFKSSRIAISEMSEAYLEYINRMLPGTIVDLAGTGKSLIKLVENSNYKDTQLMFVANKSTHRNVRAFLQQDTTTRIEFMNLARHPMYVGESTTFNPTNTKWDEIEEIKIMHDTFMKACDVTTYYSVLEDTKLADNILIHIIKQCLINMEGFGDSFRFTDKFFGLEHEATISRVSKK